MAASEGIGASTRPWEDCVREASESAAKKETSLVQTDIAPKVRAAILSDKAAKLRSMILALEASRAEVVMDDLLKKKSACQSFDPGDGIDSADNDGIKI